MDASTAEPLAAFHSSDLPAVARLLAARDAAAFDEIAVRAADSAEVAARAARLEAELAAKSARVAELEATVSRLEAEVSRMRATRAGASSLESGSGGTCEAARVSQQEELKDQVFDGFDVGLGGNERKFVKIANEALSCDDVTEIGEGEDGVGGEERQAIDDVEEGGSGGEGVLPLLTPSKRALRVVASDSENDGGIADAKQGDESAHKEEVEEGDVTPTVRRTRKRPSRVFTSDSENKGGIADAKQGNGSDHEDEVEEGDIFPTATRTRKRPSQVVTSDSENEDGDNRDNADRMTADAEEGVHTIPPSSRKRGAQIVASDSENEDSEDDRIPIGEVLKKLRQHRGAEDEKELGDMEENFMPPTRCLTRLQRGHPKNVTKRGRAAHRKLDYTDSKEEEKEEDSSESEGDSLGGFIVNESDSVESASSSSEESSSRPGETDSDVEYKDVMAGLRRERNAENWQYEGDMLSAFSKHPELCLKAVCALYRQQTSDEQSAKAALVHNKRGFNQIDALRGSYIAQFLLNGDPSGPLQKTVQELEEYDSSALKFCHKLAHRYSKQLFAIYQNKEDPYFLPS